MRVPTSGAHTTKRKTKGKKKVFNNLRLPTGSSTSTSLTRLWIHKSPGRKSCTENKKSEKSTMCRCQKWRKFSKSSSLLYLFLSKHKPTDHCSISQEQRHQKNNRGLFRTRSALDLQSLFELFSINTYLKRISGIIYCQVGKGLFGCFTLMCTNDGLYRNDHQGNNYAYFNP